MGWFGINWLVYFFLWIDKLIDWFGYRLTSWFVYKLTSWSIDLVKDWLVDFFYKLISWLIGFTVSTSWEVDWFKDRLVEMLIGLNID